MRCPSASSSMGTSVVAASVADVRRTPGEDQTPRWVDRHLLARMIDLELGAGHHEPPAAADTEAASGRVAAFPRPCGSPAPPALGAGSAACSQIALESINSLLPEAPVPLRPAGQLPQRVGLQRAVVFAPLDPAADQARSCSFEQAQVLGHRVEGHAKGSAISPTVREPPARRARIARRVASPSAPKARSSAASDGTRVLGLRSGCESAGLTQPLDLDRQAPLVVCELADGIGEGSPPRVAKANPCDHPLASAR